MGKPKPQLSGKRATVKRKGVNFGLRGKCSVYKVTLGTSVVMVILGSLGAFPIFDNIVSRNRLDVERNRVNFGPQW